MPEEQASNLGYWNDSDFNAQRDAGLSARNKPRSLLPKRPFGGSKVGDTILNALLGVSAGVKAGSDVNKLGDPILSFLTGAGGAAGAPQVQDIRDQRDVAQSQAEIQRLQLTPLKTVAPGIAEKYGLNPDMPLGLAKEVLPIVARAEDLEKQLLLITARGAQARETVKEASKIARPGQSEFAARAFADKAKQADDNLKALVGAGFDPTSKTLAVEGKMPNLLKRGQVQQNEQALRQFVNAVLRRESGAAIPQSELESYRRQYWPEAGDSKATLTQKERARELAILGLEAEGARVGSAIDESEASGLSTADLMAIVGYK